MYFFIVGMISPLSIWARLCKHFCCLSGIQAPVISSLTLQSWLWDPPGSACSLHWIFSLLVDVAEMTRCHVSRLDAHLAQFRGPTVVKPDFQWGIYHLDKKTEATNQPLPTETWTGPGV